MVVAAGTRDAKPQRSARDYVDAVVDDVVDVVAELTAGRTVKETHRRQRAVIELRDRTSSAASCSTMKRSRGRSLLNAWIDVVAVRVGERMRRLLRDSERRSLWNPIRGDIRPVPARQFAVQRRRQRDDRRPSPPRRASVLFEGLHFRVGRQQADEVERTAPQERLQAIDGGDGVRPADSSFGQHKRSIGVFTHASFFTAGGEGEVTG